jgi:signal transduction histidine kinase/CheY-like chemotaxis protein/transposase-like protein
MSEAPVARVEGSNAAELSSRMDDGADLLMEAFEFAPPMMGIIELTEDGDIFHVRDNLATCAFFGLEPGGTRYQLASSMGVNAETLRLWTTQYRKSAATGQPERFEFTHVEGDDVRSWFVAVRPLSTAPSARQRFMYVAEDVTERKRAEQAQAQAEKRLASALRELQERETRLRELYADLALRADELHTLLDVAPMAIYIAHDVDCARVTANRAGSDLIEIAYRGDQALEPSHRELIDSLQIYRDGRKVGPKETPLSLAARGTPSHCQEYELRLRNGGIRYVWGEALPLHGPDGKVRGAIAAFADVTVPVRTRQAKDAFIATLAHELRNPLAPILHAVQILRGKDPPDPTMAWARDVIYRQVRQLAWLLDDLLDVSRMGRGNLELRKEHIALTSVIDLAIETSRPLIDAGGHELRVDVPGDAIRVDADPVRLAQIISNLLNNAAKFTPRGGRIDLCVELAGPDVVLRVRDTGIGISREALPEIFDLFTSSGGATDGAERGLGIGLSIVRGLVQLHGGTVSAHSEGQGKGSEFVVTIPLAERTSSTPDARDSVPPQPVKHRVLVVDDNRDGADTLAKLLEIVGCEVKVVYGGRQALELADAFRPSMVFLDIGMPGMNGVEVARKLRETSWGRTMRLVAVTGWGQEKDRRQTEAAGFDEHLVKPVDVAVLHRLLHDLHSLD